MGHELASRGVEAIHQMPMPENRAALQRVLGMATYLARFCPNYSELTALLRELLLKDNEFHWDIRHTEGFTRLKDLLTRAPVLLYNAPDKPLTVQCDASQFGLGAVILQDGKPVEYASGAMTKT